MKTSNALVSGSTLLAVMITSLLLSGMTATVLMVTLNRRHTVNQSVVWEEALTAAEAGVHQGVAQVELALSQNSLPANPSTNTGQTFSVSLSHDGGDSSGANAQYTLTRNDVVSGGMTRPYYSIVSTGSIPLPGARWLGSNSRDTVLRKLNLTNGGSTLMATRTVEAWLRPKYNNDTAPRSDGSPTLNNHNIYLYNLNSDYPKPPPSGGQAR